MKCGYRLAWILISGKRAALRIIPQGFSSADDFIPYYTGGKYLLTSRLNVLYDFAGQEVFQLETLRLQSAQFTPFSHPPFATLFYYASFALASFEWRASIVVTAGLAALSLAWRLLQQELSALSKHSPF